MPCTAQAVEPTKPPDLFARENLVAWCIVPFDSQKRGPEERAAMLKKLGFTKFAYDYRAEHIPTFDAEVEALKKQGIELTAWWFPGAMNDEARLILDVLKRHEIKTQLWVTGGGEPTKSADEQQARVKAEAARIRPIAEEAAKICCTVGLYNHGGWFGEPENQIAIIEELKLPNVGIVYNQHHGHDHLDRFPELLKRMLPHLVCLNLNGMMPDGERRGQKILPLGQGDLDLQLLKTIQTSGYRGPIGILGHTQDDAEQRLLDNLDGLDWLVAQLDGTPPGPKPKPRTPVPPPIPDSKRAATKPARPLENHWGKEVIGFDWQESDSVDNRWNETDIGPFLASIVPLPDGRAKLPLSRGSAGASPSRVVEKGLSIKVGDRGQAAVCYDTERGSLRAAWTGGFLKFHPARYGLINSPQIAGDLAFASLHEVGWQGDVQYRGLHLQHPRVVLTFDVDGKRVQESPWLEERDGLALFTRTIEVAPAQQPLKCFVGRFAGASEIVASSNGQTVCVRDGERVVACSLKGNGELRAVAANNEVTIELTISESTKPRALKLLLWSGDTNTVSQFVAAAERSEPPESLAEMRQPGPRRWTEEIITRGVLSPDESSAFVVDTLTLPFENPYKALFFVSGHDFFSSGDLALCTVHGDVWLVSGIDEKLERLVWRRFATGLFQPLGLEIVDEQVFVLCRDQITQLVDNNADGEADEYRCFSNRYPTSAGGHDYVTCLETDSKARFHFLHATEGLMRVSADGSRVEAIATGLRNPNGMGLGPDDIITASPQEGEWTPGSAIFEVRPGNHFGYLGPRAGHGSEGFDPPLAWLPRMMDNSSGGQVWAGPGWGPLSGHMLHMSYGKCRMMLVLREQIGEVTQGAVIELPLDFRSGIMRGRVSPRDGQLYLSGLKGWASAAVDDGCLQRVRYTGRPLTIPVDRRTYANGLAITFSEPLDRATAEDAGSYLALQWNYHYSAAYGSADFKVSDPDSEGHDEIAVRSATLLEGGKTVFLEIADFRPAMQTGINYSLKTAAGESLRQMLVATTHVVPERRMDESRLRRPAAAESIVDESALRPGVVLRFTQGQLTSTRTARLIAWRVESGEPPASELPAGEFEAVATAYVKVPLRGEYEFELEGIGDAELWVNEQKLPGTSADIATSQPAKITLRQGYNRVKLRYRAPASGAAACRLLWTDGVFPLEPVPPTSLYYDARDESVEFTESRRRGFWLAAQKQCKACHDLSGMGSRVGQQGPDLSVAGQRLEPEWVYHWLLDPAAQRPQANMPRVLPDTNEGRQMAADLAMYLAGLTDPRLPPNQAIGGDAQVGLSLYEDLGCIACHRFSPPAENDPYDRISLVHAGAKFQPGVLPGYLRNPAAHDYFSRMPNFALSADEAAALAAYLQKNHTSLPDVAALSTADPQRGKQWFGQRCAMCHSAGNASKAVSQPPVPINDSAGGCLSADDWAGNYPRYSLTQRERSELVAFIDGEKPKPSRALVREMLPHMMKSLRCSACHNLDHETAPLRRIMADESESGQIPDSLPNLIWAGEKLQSSWLIKLLTGKLTYRTRPWLKARMPSFSQSDAMMLTEGLAAEFGLPHELRPASPPEVDGKIAKLGDQLTRKDGGLDCRQCHAVGRDQPVGDERTRVAPGINFSHTRQRLREDYYHRFVLDPPRYDITTKMPKLSADGKTTKLAEVLDGNARRQFDAIWEFIQTVPVEK